MKIISLLKAKDGLSRADFQSWLIEDFAPRLASASPTLRGLMIRPAVEPVAMKRTSTYVPVGPRYPWPAYDAVLLWWFDDVAGFEGRHGDGAEGAALAKAFEEHCALHHSYAVDPTVVVGPDDVASTDQGAAFIGPVVWLPMPRERALEYWGEHAKIVRKVHVGTGRYERNPVIQILEGPKVDGFVDFAFRTEHDLTDRYFPSDEDAAEHGADVAQFVADSGRVQVGPAIRVK